MSSQSSSSMSNKDTARIFTVLSRIDVALNDIPTTCAEFKAGAAVTSLKLDRAIATLEGHSGRIKALETRHEHDERYLQEVKSCPELKIMGIPSALACTADSDLRHLCASILELFGAGHTITDVQEIRWLSPPSDRRTGIKIPGFIAPYTQQTNQCQMLLSGVLFRLELSDNQVLEKTFSTMDLKHHERFITKTQSCKPRNSLSVKEDTRAIIFQCSSSIVRDGLVAQSYKLARIGNKDLFDTGGESQLSLSPLWPKSCDVRL
ncbi:hypothetical protein TKK_0012457 [Trichogramma kaykai]|uniref:Uncharacterized protein n=1 Tax=Trichogramma kaykai TaxID=54128 RepID=A0ABD2WPQ9_9HYME